MAFGLWCVSVCVPFGCGDCPLWEFDEAVIVCGCTTEGLGLHCDNTSRVLAHYTQSTGALPQRTGRVLQEYCHSTARVLVQYSQNTGTAPLNHCHSTTRVLVQYSKSTGTILPEQRESAHPRVLAEYTRLTHPRVLPECANSSPRTSPQY